MSQDQKAARIFGALFLLTFVTSIAGALLYGPVLDQHDYVLHGDANGRITLGALLEIGLVVANIGTAVVLYPIARRYSEVLSLSFVASRIVESTVIAVGAISVLSIVTLNQESTGDSDALLVQAESLVAVKDWTFLFGPGFCVGVGNGIILGALMWKSGLIPRRLALLGLVGGPLILIRATLIMFDVVDHGDPTDILAVPEILWELSLGLYPLVMASTSRPRRSSMGCRRRRATKPGTGDARRLNDNERRVRQARRAIPPRRPLEAPGRTGEERSLDRLRHRAPLPL